MKHCSSSCAYADFPLIIFFCSHSLFCNSSCSFANKSQERIVEEKRRWLKVATYYRAWIPNLLKISLKRRCVTYVTLLREGLVPTFHGKMCLWPKMRRYVTSYKRLPRLEARINWDFLHTFSFLYSRPQSIFSSKMVWVSSGSLLERWFTGLFCRPCSSTRRLGRLCGLTRFNPIILRTYKRCQGWYCCAFVLSTSCPVFCHPLFFTLRNAYFVVLVTLACHAILYPQSTL